MKKVFFAYIFAVYFCVVFLHVIGAEDVLEQTKQIISNADYTVSMSISNTKDDIVEYLNSTVSEMLSDNVEVLDITVKEFEPATMAKQGRFVFAVELAHGNSRLTTDKITGIIDTSHLTVSVTQGTSSATKGENVVLTAAAYGIKDPVYSWYRSTGPDIKGILVEGENSPEFTVPTQEAYTAYFYCSVGEISSNYIKINVSLPYVPVSFIELDEVKISSGENEVLSYKVLPEDATYRSVRWDVVSVEGEATVSSNTIKAIKEGEITLVAHIDNGKSEGEEYIQSFSVLIEPSKNVPEFEVDIKIDNVEKIICIGGNKVCNIKELSSLEKENALKDAGRSKSKYDVISAFSSDIKQNGQRFKIILEDAKDNMTVLCKNGDEISAYECSKDKENILPEADSYIFIIQTSAFSAQGIVILCASVIPVLLFGVILIINKNNKRKYLL